MMTCIKCDNEIDETRYHLGYKECTDCSDEEKYSAHTVYPHKTGGYVQPVKKSQSDNLKRMDRRSTGGGKRAKGIICLLYTSPSPRDRQKSRMPSSA